MYLDILSFFKVGSSELNNHSTLSVGSLFLHFWINLNFALLAHLSLRLTRWAYSIQMVRCRPHFRNWISLKPDGQSWSNFMCSISGVGEKLHKDMGQIGSKYGFHGNRKPPLIYTGETDVSIFSRLFLIPSFLYLQVMRTCSKSRTSLNFGQIRPLTTELAFLECLKNFIDLEWKKSCLHATSFIFVQIIIKVAGNQDRHKSLDKFDFGPDQTTHFGVTCPWMTKILHFRTWISLRPVGQSWSNFMCSITGGGERLHNVLKQIGSKLWCPWQQKAPIDL